MIENEILDGDDIEALHHYDSVVAELNEAFHRSYHRAIQNSHAKLGQKDTPAIVVSGDHVTLFHDGRQEKESIIPPLYQRVKSISHLSFGIYVTLSSIGYGPLAEDARADLANQLELLDQGMAILDKLDIPPEFVALQRDTFSSAVEIVRDVLAAGRVDEERVLEFGRVSAPLYLDNAALAARLELDQLHQVVSRWRDQIGQQEWQKVYVVICAAHQARYRETTKQYFQRLLHEKEEALGANYENRVVYAEHIYDNDAAIDLLARHLVDQKTSLALFGSRTRLQEDLMSDGAATYLGALMGA